MRSAKAAIALFAMAAAAAAEVEHCPVCQGDLVTVASQTDDKSKPSRNIAVWNRSMCANPFFGKGSLICPKDGYAWEAGQLKHWELSLENRDGFAHPLDPKIHDFPLPARDKLTGLAVYSQTFITLSKVKHELRFWTINDEARFKAFNAYASENGIVLSIERHGDLGPSVCDCLREQDLQIEGHEG